MIQLAPSCVPAQRALVSQAHKVTYVMPTGRKVLEVSPSTSLLKAAVAAGLDVPSVCGAGNCGEGRGAGFGAP